MSPGADETRIRHMLRRLGVGPDAPPPTPAPPRPASAPPHADWWDRLYADPDDQADDEPPAPETPWWSWRPWPRDTAGEERAEPTVTVPGNDGAPTVHITVTQGQADRAEERRYRRMRWLMFHGTAAGAGWGLGLGPTVAHAIATARTGALGFGIALGAIGCLPGLYLPQLRVVPAPLRPAVLWICRIWPSTVALALALHTPHALI